MARLQTLATAAQLFRVETGIALTPGAASGRDQEIYGLIESKQKWLASEFDWSFLKNRVDVAVPAGTTDATRYGTLPTTIDFSRPVKVSALYQSLWYPVEQGIGAEEFNAINSDDDASVSVIQRDPIARWDYKPGNPLLFEVWPLPATNHTLRFEGMRTLTSLRASDNLSYNIAAKLDLDDLLVVYYCAAEFLKRNKDANAPEKLALAEKRFLTLRANDSKRDRIDLCAEDAPQRKYIKISVG